MTLGLALGGGAAYGAAHLGVLQVLAERRIRPALVTGTSAGALVGAAYAGGLSLRTIERLILSADWSTFGRLSLSPRLGLLDTSALAETIAELGGSPRVEELPRRFAAVTTDLVARREVVLATGPLADALRASIAVPGLFPPVRVGGRLLVDGGLVANLPIRAARELGADHVIGVRLRPEWDRLPFIPSSTRIAAMERASSTTMIRPAVDGMSQWSRADLSRLIAEGRRAAAEALDAVARDAA